MKKRTRKLTLNRETLKTLEMPEMNAPAGVLGTRVDQITVSGCTCPETGCPTEMTVMC